MSEGFTDGSQALAIPDLRSILSFGLPPGDGILEAEVDSSHNGKAEFRHSGPLG